MIFRTIRPEFFLFFVLLIFFPNKLGSEDEIKNKNKILSDHFPIELKSKEISFDLNSIGNWSE